MKAGRGILIAVALVWSPLWALERCSSDLFYLFRALDARSFLSGLESQEEQYPSWTFQIIPSFSKTSHAFDCGACCQDLASYIFAPTVLLQDIYCPSRLAKEGILLGGCDAEHNYVIELADAQLNFCADQKTLECDIALFKTWCVRDFLDVTVGLNVPVKYRKRTLDFHLTHGDLARLVETSSQFTPWANNLSEFFSEFNSAEDFVLRHVLQRCKNLTYKECQSCFGVGDIGVSLFANIEGEWCEEYLSNISFGCNVTTPSSNDCNDEQIVWELSLGNRGATVVEPFFYADFQYNKWLNPSLFLSVCIVPTYGDIQRVPRVISGTPDDFEDVLCLPDNFNAGIVTEDFQCCDSLVPRLADKAVDVCFDPGTGLVVRLGNQVVLGCVSLGLYYTYDSQGNGQSFIQAEEDQEFDVSCLNISDDSTAHLVEWHMGLSSHVNMEWAVGSRHIVAGKDVFKTNQFFFQFLVRY